MRLKMRLGIDIRDGGVCFSVDNGFSSRRLSTRQTFELSRQSIRTFALGRVSKFNLSYFERNANVVTKVFSLFFLFSQKHERCFVYNINIIESIPLLLLPLLLLFLLLTARMYSYVFMLCTHQRLRSCRFASIILYIFTSCALL